MMTQDPRRHAAHQVLRQSIDELARLGEKRRRQKLYRDGRLRVEPEAVDASLVRETARALDMAHDALYADEHKQN
jgi:hypothetical protein